MTPVPVPTDNLYKFCALMGIVLIVASTYYCWARADDLLRRAIRITTDQKKERIERDSLRKKIELEDKFTKDLQASITALKESGAQLNPELPKALAELQRSALASEEILKQRDLKGAEIEGATEEAQFAQMQLKLVRWIGAAGIIIGIHLSAYGFVNWRKIQIIQDELLRKQR